jgi:hypothetical protein
LTKPIQSEAFIAGIRPASAIPLSAYIIVLTMMMKVIRSYWSKVSLESSKPSKKGLLNCPVFSAFNYMLTPEKAQA